MSKIQIKVMSDEALSHIKRNIKKVTKKLIDESNNDWVNKEFGDGVFIVKSYSIDDFVLEDNPESRDKKIDIENHLKIYNALHTLPTYVLTDEKFWLWLYLDKFYSYTRVAMSIRGVSTIKDHWMFGQAYAVV